MPLKFGIVSGYFGCGDNKLTSLEGCPTEVGGDFYCGVNYLTSLRGAPTEVCGDLLCYGNKLTTLEHFPKVKGDIRMGGNQLPDEILDLTQDKLKEVIKEQDFYEIWRDGQLFEPRWIELKIDLNIN